MQTILFLTAYLALVDSILAKKKNSNIAFNYKILFFYSKTTIFSF